MKKFLFVYVVCAVLPAFLRNEDQITKCFYDLQTLCGKTPQGRMINCATEAINQNKMENHCLPLLFGDIDSSVEDDSVKAQDQGGEGEEYSYEGGEEEESSDNQYGEDFTPDDAMVIFSPAEKACIDVLVKRCENAESAEMIELCVNKGLDKATASTPCVPFMV